MQPWRNPLRLIMFISGWISLSLGIAGIFLPVLPTTPFLLLTAFLWLRSSERWHQWLLRHPLFGHLIRDWQERGVIRTKTKAIATVMMLPLYLMAFFSTQIPMVGKVSLLIIGTSVLLFIWTRPSK